MNEQQDKPILRKEFNGGWFYAVPTRIIVCAIWDAVALSSFVDWTVKSAEEEIDKLDPEGYHIITGVAEDVYASGWHRCRILSKQKSGIEPIPILIDISSSVMRV